MIYYYNEYEEYVGRSVGSATWPFAVRPTTSISSGASGTLRENSIKYIQVVIYTGIPSPVTISALDELNVQVKCNDTSTYYVDPDHNEISINLASSAGSTVYSGDLTLNEDGSGTLVVDMGVVVFDGDESWDSAESQQVQYVQTSRYLPGADLNAYEKVVCSHLIMQDRTASSALPVGAMCYNTTKRNLLANMGFTSVDDLKTYLSTNPMTVIYPLDTTLTYTLTATQIQTLVGTNHVWTDAGEITLTYRSDKYAELERRISQLEALVLES